MLGTLLAGRYEITTVLGEGGLGVVYAATDRRTGAPVAVKFLHPALARDPALTRLMQAEARLLASLTSPRVVRVIDFDEHDGSFFLVTEFVAGEVLADRLLARGTLPPAEALTIGLEVARTLEAVAAAGVLHGDLKPQNIMVVDGQVKVLDFGVAMPVEAAAARAEGAVLGTPAYMAPERLRGGRDIRGDIYAVGVILFELLEGRPPFAGPMVQDLFRQHATEPPPPLSPGIPQSVQELVARCLAKQPSDRFQTPTELATALRAALHALPEGEPELVAEPDRVLTTLLFTDIVRSTERAATLGDRRWRAVLARHDALVQRALGRFDGRLIKTTGDGIFATFAQPSRGVRCARAIVQETAQLSLAVRAGLHTGECELLGDDLGGIGVVVGARIAAVATAGEVLVSRTVTDVVTGSGLRFTERGSHALRGVPGEWHLYAVQ